MNHQIDMLLAMQSKHIRSSAKLLFANFWNAVSEQTGECTEAFNEVLRAGASKGLLVTAFSSSPPCPFSTPLALAANILITAAVLAKIYAIPRPTPESAETEMCGWDGLNADAKVWCRALLTALPPAGANASELRDLFVAKTFVGLLLEDEIPKCQRTVTLPAPPWTKEGMKGVDD